MKIESIEIHGIKSHEDSRLSSDSYTIIVGENNAGKSTVFLALLWFFGEQKISYIQTLQGSEEVYVQITFGGIGEKSVLKQFSNQGKVAVRASKKKKDDEKAFGPEYSVLTVGAADKFEKLAKLPDEFEILFVPAVRSLSDELKLTASSSFNKLVQKVLASRMAIEDGKGNKYQKVLEAIQSLSVFMSTGKNGALTNMAKVVEKNMLSYQGVSLEFDFKPLSVDDLIKNCLDPHTKIEGFKDTKFPISVQGDGFQRSLTFSLIASLSEVEPDQDKLTVYLMEEPELFLHPNHQIHFRGKLETIAKKLGNQVFVTSHSPYFVSNVHAYSQIKRTYLEKRRTKIAELSDEDVQIICDQNGKLMATAQNDTRTKKWDLNELADEASRIAKDDHLRYLLWIDPRRANAFLSNKVLLVEGSTEKAFFSYIFDNEKSPLVGHQGIPDVAVIDVNGKYHMFKFIELLKSLDIAVWCIHDTDNDKETGDISHKVLNKNLDDLLKSGSLKGKFAFAPDIEGALGLKKGGNNPDIEIYKALEKNEGKCKETKAFQDIIAFTAKMLAS